MPELMAQGGVLITDEEALILGGNTLIVPENATVVTRTRYKGKPNEEEYLVSSWKEVLTIDDIKPDYKPEKSKYLDVQHEKCWIPFRVAGEYQSRNQGRRVNAWFDFMWGLRKFSSEQMKEWAEILEDGDIRATYNGKYFGTQKSVTRFSSLLKALGHEDRLVGKKVFKGFPTVEDLFPTFVGRQVTGKIEQSPGLDGTPRDEIVGFEAL